ncbi:hypothetical protein pb186bvf_015969 [Paramecium bursaria]
MNNDFQIDLCGNPNKIKAYSAKGKIFQMRSCSNQYISFFDHEKQQIRIFDPAKQIVFRKYIPQGVSFQDCIHLITNDLNNLILVKENWKIYIYEYSSNKLVDKLQGEIIGYLNNKIIFSKYDFDQYIITVDFFSKNRYVYKLKTQNNLNFYCLENYLLTTKKCYKKLKIINLIWKTINIEFKSRFSLSQVNLNNKNQFLFQFNEPSCLRFMVKQYQKFKQIRKISMKSKIQLLSYIGNQIIYFYIARSQIYQMNLSSLSFKYKAKVDENAQILCTKNQKHLVWSIENNMKTLDIMYEKC